MPRPEAGGILTGGAEEGENGGGVVVQPVADAAGLLKVERDRIQEGPAEQDRRQHQQHIAQGKEQKVLPVISCASTAPRRQAARTPPGA